MPMCVPCEPSVACTLGTCLGGFAARDEAGPRARGPVGKRALGVGRIYDANEASV